MQNYQVSKNHTLKIRQQSVLVSKTKLLYIKSNSESIYKLIQAISYYYDFLYYDTQLKIILFHYKIYC